MEEGVTASFLQDELDAFDKIYSELLGIANSDKDTEEKKKMAAELRRRSRILASQTIDAAQQQQQQRRSCHFKSSQSELCDRNSCSSCAHFEGSDSKDNPGCPNCEANRQNSPELTTANGGRQSPFSPRSSVVADLEADIEDLSFIASGQQYDTGNKLFLDLLDDLDNISGNTPSARRRKRARDLFSEWLFSQEAIDEESPQKNKDSFSEYVEQFDASFFAAINPKPLRHRNLHARWRPKSRLFDYQSEDDADSGYHTGESTLQATPAPAPHVPSERTLTREDLRRRIDAFNNNQHGLLMTLNEEVLTFQGFIRVHMNLMRPISMVLPMRPPSIYDVISSDGEGSDDGGEGVDQDTLTTSFYLPKDTSKVIHITSSTTTSEVIRALLQKFKITDNPRKFALYEKIIDGDKPSMRRMVDDERPLPLCLSWSCEGLDSRKFVLQENDTGEIIWDEFSIPELENFLRILDREEEEYVEQVKARYTLLRIQMQKEMNAIAEEEKEKELFDKPEDKPPDPSSDDGSSSDKNLQPDNREPVFV